MEGFVPPFRLHIACGSYDGTVFAMLYEHICINLEGPSILKAVFIDPDAHPSPVTAIALSGDLVVSGSSDEAIQVFSLSHHCRLGCLELHTGSIRHLQFAIEPNKNAIIPRHLISAGEDACVAIWRRHASSSTQSPSQTRPSAWQCIRQMRRHKGAITAFALHPSCRAAITLSEDKTLRIWNLTRGRQAYTVRLKALTGETAIPSDIHISPSGKFLLISWPTRFDLVNLIADVSTGRAGKPIASCQFEKVFSAGAPVFFHEDDDYVYLLAGVSNRLKAYRCQINTVSGSVEALGDARLPGKRVKFIKILAWPAELVEREPAEYTGRQRLVVAGTTDLDGSYIRGYVVNLEGGSLSAPKAILPVFTYDVNGIRLTQVDAGWVSSEVSAENEIQQMQVDDNDDSEDEDSELESDSEVDDK